MMRTMRSIAPWIMAIVAVSFVGWMVFEVGMDVQGQSTGAPLDEVARVNGRKIDAQTFYAAVRQAQEMARQQGAPPARTLEEQRQLEDQVLEQLVQQILLQDEFRRQEITVTDDELRQALRFAPLPDLRSVEIFQTDGEFDLAKYQRYLLSGADPGFALALEARYREELPRVKYFERIALGASVSDGKLWQLYRDRNDSVTATVVALVPAAVVPDDEVEVSQEELRAYFETHAADYEQPAQAFLTYVTISRKPNATDSATALERARALRDEILAGTDFEAVAARESADSSNRELGGDLGDVGRGDFVPPFEEAALALRPGELSQPVLTRFGYHLIRLESREGDTYHPRHILIPIEPYGDHLDMVDRQADSLDMLAAEQDDPTILDSVAVDMNLEMRPAVPLRQGMRMVVAGDMVPDVGVWAFEAQPGQTSSVIETRDAYYVFRLDSVLAAGVPPLEEVAQRVTRDARTAKKWERTREVARAIADAVAAGADLEAAAEQQGAQARSIGPFTRANPGPVLAQAPEAVGAAFGLRLGSVGGPYEEDFAIFLVEPTRFRFADSTAFAAELGTLREREQQQAQQNLLQLVLSSVRQGADVEDKRRELLLAQQQQQQQLPNQSPLGFLR
ncbi:MAG: peptidylprolyl isomerase [Gemmatimonadota bacterium]|nr:MAG: peptidylprolyl isomerase [Gemmatimonadota bacterium]